MDITFSKPKARITFNFMPREIFPARSAFKEIIEDEISAGNRVPENVEDLIRGLMPTEKVLVITFYFDYFSIASRYIERLLQRATIEGIETEQIEQFLGRVKFYMLQNTPSLKIINLDGMNI